MAAKKKGTTKKTATKAATAKEKPPKGPKPNRTFAVRITDAELDALHKAAGARNAARFARAVLAAFASGDPKAFGQVIEEAAKARG